MIRLAEIAARKRREQQAARYTVTVFKREAHAPETLKCFAEGCTERVGVEGSGYCRRHWRLARRQA